MKTLDPGSHFVVKWKRLLLIMGMLNMIIDPYFLYIFNAEGPKCLGIDVEAAKLLSFFRTFLDLFLFLNMILKCFIALEIPGPKEFKKRELVRDSYLIAINYIKSMFIVDLLALQPFPQCSTVDRTSLLVALAMAQGFLGSPTLQFPPEFGVLERLIIWCKSTMKAKKLLPRAVILQFTPRAFTMVPYDAKLMEAFGLARRNLWSGAIYNLLIFVLMGHILGALFYQVYMIQQQECFYEIYKNTSVLHPGGHDCSQLHKRCIAIHKEVDQGMLSDAFQNEIGLRSFIQKVIYCFVWGVRSLSSLGQTFEASYTVTDTIFSCGVIIFGLILLADLIARMQVLLLSSIMYLIIRTFTFRARREKQRLKQRKLEEWTHYHHLPPDLKALVRQSATTQWQDTKGIDDEAILNSLPHDLQRDIRTHLYKERVLNTPPFSRMDEELLNFICGHLRTVTKAEGTYIILQGDPLDQVVFIFTGLLQLTTHHSTSRHTHSRNLEAGDFFGDDLLTWALQPNPSTQNLPPSNFSVKCITDVEAFCLPAEHLRLLVIFNYIHRFQHALREHHA
ncbi:Cyclic nucleotide-gated ion channel 18 [Bienertia sinuspersici]